MRRPRHTGLEGGFGVGEVSATLVLLSAEGRLPEGGQT